MSDLVRRTVKFVKCIELSHTINKIKFLLSWDVAEMFDQRVQHEQGNHHGMTEWLLSWQQECNKLESG